MDQQKAVWLRMELVGQRLDINVTALILNKYTVIEEADRPVLHMFRCK